MSTISGYMPIKPAQIQLYLYVDHIVWAWVSMSYLGASSQLPLPNPGILERQPRFNEANMRWERSLHLHLSQQKAHHGPCKTCIWTADPIALVQIFRFMKTLNPLVKHTELS